MNATQATQAQQLLDCGHPPSLHGPYTAGYGYNADGKRHCYACCAEHDKQDMLATGKATLYLSEEEYVVALNNFVGPLRRKRHVITNWPGTLRFPVLMVKEGRHNIARVRYDVWFVGPDRKAWYGVQYGDNTQIIHCKRTKGK